MGIIQKEQAFKAFGPRVLQADHSACPLVA